MLDTLNRIRRKVAYQFSLRSRRDWRHMVINHGWRSVPGAFKVRLSNMLANRSVKTADDEIAPLRQPSRHHFDRVHGVETDGLIWGEDLRTGSPNDLWNTAYYGTQPSIFDAVLTHLPAEFATATFIDLGSGKGRAVLMATQYEFSRCVGVEISPQLHRIAIQNRDAYMRNQDGPTPEFVLQDAASYQFPDGPLVVYLYQPFARPVFSQVFANLVESVTKNPRPVALLYINPVLRDLLNSCNRMELVWSGRVDLDPQDSEFDHICSKGEECAIYCFKGLGLPTNRRG